MRLAPNSSPLPGGIRLQHTKTSMTRLFLVMALKLLPPCLACSPSAEQIECTISEKQNSRLSSNVLLD
jgi:hypothetical protein